MVQHVQIPLGKHKHYNLLTIYTASYHGYMSYPTRRPTNEAASFPFPPSQILKDYLKTDSVSKTGLHLGLKVLFLSQTLDLAIRWIFTNSPGSLFKKKGSLYSTPQIYSVTATGLGQDISHCVAAPQNLDSFGWPNSMPVLETRGKLSQKVVNSILDHIHLVQERISILL